MIVTIESRTRVRNDRIAAENRARLNEARVCAVNLLSAPDAGKTSLLESTIEALRADVRVAVVAGDTRSAFDARRLSQLGVPVVQVLLHGECHLDAALVERALDQFEDAGLLAGPAGLELLLIENVDQLHCMPGVDLGEQLRVVMLSASAGDEALLGCQEAVRSSSALIINKTDLVPFAHCDLEAMHRLALQGNPGLAVFETSCTTRQGVSEWCAWLARHVARRG